MLINKSDLARARYGAQTFDCALPQTWLDEMTARGIDARPHFVWLYPAGDIFGFAAPIDSAGDAIAAETKAGEGK
jgi:hypothetical protein